MKYKTILADPPWDYDAMGKRHRGRSPRDLPHEKYPCMTMDDLCALPIADIAETNSHLYIG